MAMDRNALDDEPYTTADVLNQLWHGYRPGPLPDWMRYGDKQFALPPRDQGEIRNVGPRPTPELQERIAEGISPVGNTFTPLREGYEALRSGDPGAIAEASVPLAAMALPIAGVKRAPIRIENPIRGYHGSPHDFAPEPGYPLGRFDLSKMGTGEGAQAYGHGLYFAEKPEVAASYKQQLARPIAQSEAEATARLAYIDGEIAKVQSRSYGADERDKQIAMRSGIRNLERDKAQLEAIIREKAYASDNPGRMYEVALHARPEEFLDTKVPFDKQTAEVQAALRPYREAVAEDWKVNPTLQPPSTFSGISAAASDIMPKAAEKIAQSMREMGIHGVRYPDAFSRPDKTIEKTHNFVVWSPEIIEILRKYGIAGPALMGPAIANALAGDEQSQ